MIQSVYQREICQTNTNILCERSLTETDPLWLLSFQHFHIDHNALCLSPQNFAWPLFTIYPGVLRYSQEKFKQCWWKIIFVKQGALLFIPEIVVMANEPGAQIHFRKNARRRIRVPSSEALWPKWRLDKGSPGKKRYLHRIDRNKPTYH